MNKPTTSLLRAMAFGALLWGLIFLEVSVLMFGFKLVPADGFFYYFPHYLFVALLTGICACLYFRGKSTKPGLKEGLFAGLIMAITGIVLDAVFTVPLFIGSYSFFLDIMLAIGFLEGIAVAGIVGKIKSRQ